MLALYRIKIFIIVEVLFGNYPMGEQLPVLIIIPCLLNASQKFRSQQSDKFFFIQSFDAVDNWLTEFEMITRYQAFNVAKYAVLYSDSVGRIPIFCIVGQDRV